MEDQYMTYGILANLYENQFTKAGSQFIGWSILPDGDVMWHDGDEALNLADEQGEIVFLYAIWRTAPISVNFNSSWDQFGMTFDAAGGEGGWSKKLDVGDEITPPEVYWLNHTFNGWSPTPPETMPENDVTCVAQWTALPLTAKVTTKNATATCSNVSPAGATVQYSTKSQTSGYKAGTQFTLDFSSGATTKNGWFKLSSEGLTDAIYKVAITKSVTQNWSNWSTPTGPWTNKQVAVWLIALKNKYGSGNYETRAASNSHGIYIQERHVTGTSTSYSSKITKVQ